MSTAEQPGDTGQPDEFANVPEAPQQLPDAPIPVAEQKAAGVPPEETVTIAEQKAGTPPPDVVLPDPAPGPEQYTAGAQQFNPPGDGAGLSETAVTGQGGDPAGPVSVQPKAEGGAAVGNDYTSAQSASNESPVLPPNAQAAAAKADAYLGAFIQIATELRAELQRYFPHGMGQAADGEIRRRLQQL